MASKRCAIVVTGGPLTGKKVVCQRAAGYANLVPYLHVSDVNKGFLQLARTIATWFIYIDSEEIRECAGTVISHLEKKRWCRAQDECINLVNLAIKNELQACFLIDRVHLLDDFSVSLIRECLHGRSRRRCLKTISSDSNNNSVSSLESDPGKDGNGKICFLCVHLPLYSYKSADRMRNDITRSHVSLNIPIVIVGEATESEMLAMTVDISGFKPSKRYMDAVAPSCGNCAGYYAERSGALRKLSSTRRCKGKRDFVDLNGCLEWCIPFGTGTLRAVKSLPVTRISGEVAMKFSNVFDVLPPLLQTFCKVLTVASRTNFFELSRVIMWNVLNDLLAEGVEIDAYNIMIDEMIEMHLLKISLNDEDEVLSLQCPALGDIAFDVCTPVQLKSIGGALIERLDPRVFDNFVVPFVLANLHDLVGCEYKVKEELWIQGYKRFLHAIPNWDTSLVARWKERIADEIRALGCTQPEVVMGKDPTSEIVFCKNSISATMMILKQYHSPISFGPLGLTFNVITANLYLLCGEFHDK